MRLYPHQREGIRWLEARGWRGIIADDMGLGKTRTATVALRKADRWPALVLVPASTVGAWMAELAQWGIRPYAWSDRHKGQPQGERVAVVASHQALARTPDLARLSWGALLIDEAHEFRNPKAKKTKAVVRCRADVRVLLTGSPVLNRRDDLLVLLELLGVTADVDDPGFDLGNYALRRLKSAVVDLPGKTRVDHEVDLGATGRALYQEALDNVEALAAASIRKGRIKEARRLVRKARRRGVAPYRALSEAVEAVNVPVDLEEAAEARAAALGHLRRILGKLKAPAIAQWIANTGRREGPFVVFAQHKAPLVMVGKGLAKHGWRAAMLHGALTQAQRTRLVAAFQAGKLDILLCTQAGYQGITLHRAQHLVFAERWWVPAWESQAEDRIHRIGQERDVFIHRFHAPDTVDELVEEILAAKTVIMEELVEQDAVSVETGTVTPARLRLEVAKRLVPRSLRVEITRDEVLGRRS